MPRRTLHDAAATLRQQFPPGDENLHAWEDPDSWVSRDMRSKGRLLLAMQQAADSLRAEMNPATAVEKLSDWESIFRFASSRIARFGGTPQRQAQVVSKWREFGATAIPIVQAIIGPLLGYADPTQLEIIECSRSGLRALHTYSWPDGNIPAMGQYNELVHVADNLEVSAAGAFIRVNLTFPTIENLAISVSSPGFNVVLAITGALGVGSVTNKQYAFFAPTFAGQDVDGDWTLNIDNNGASTGTVNVSSGIQTDVFVEGIGRVGLTTEEGLGAFIFEWGVVVDPALEGVVSPSDRSAALAALQRIKPAHTIANLLIATSIDGACCIPDVSLPDASIPCD